ncbi:MAG: molybdopterin-synthase adenylyltransferase MoeB [Xanthomonadales bacterium]|nr:molybdopterin-synthase adenylyltransferase MoeB [Gammaproteobacteria bacterium]NND57377.1 molybdopterin-synthase adenylyltransferase MoeB [Xanthomonadales bacterium]
MSKQRETDIEIPVRDAAKSACPSRPLIDIRTPEERQLGIPVGSIRMSAGEVLQCCRDDDRFAARGAFIFCSEGVRSKTTVLQLRRAGFTGFTSVTGGFNAWKSSGLPTEYFGGLDSVQTERYARHLVMPQVGARGQLKLRQARILLVGLGGLNSPVALYLAAAGVGKLGLVDFDTVERSNLQRQIVHSEAQLGRQKVTSADDRIRELNPDVETVTYPQRVTSESAPGLVEPWDIVVDGTDSFSARYALNDACISQQKPLVYGAVMRFQGQVSVFWPTRQTDVRAPCFRCLFPREPSTAEAPGCAEAGVLGVLPGIVGTLQANEALKLALGIGRPLVGRLLMIDSLNMEFRQMKLPAVPGCPSCGLERP